MKHLFLKAILGLLFTLVFNLLHAQFSYTGFRLSYHNVRFDQGDIINATRLNSATVNLDLMHRPLRNFGIGASVRLPIYQGFKYYFSFDNAGEVSGGGVLDDGEFSTILGGDFNYDIQANAGFSLIGRLFFDVERNYFVDLRYTFQSYDETFSYKRSSSSGFSDQNINLSRTVNTSGVGFSFGMQPRIDDHFYITYVGTIDFLTARDQAFTSVILNNPNSGPDLRVLSKLADTQTQYEFSIGIGYRF